MSRYYCEDCQRHIILARFPKGVMREITLLFEEDGKVEYWEEQGLAVVHSIGKPGPENRRALHEECLKRQRAREKAQQP